MSIQLKLRRGTTAQHSTFTGAEGEVTVDTTKDVLVVHDGTTPGGNPMLSAAAGAVGTSNLATNAITTAKIADANVTTAKIADANVTYAKVQNVTAGKVLGRDTSSAGVVQELPIAVDSSGNVGIGTSSPTRKLSVVGSATATYINVNSGDDVSSVGVLFGGTTGPSNGQVIYNPSTNTMDFVTGGTGRARINSVGQRSTVIPSGSATYYPAYDCRAWVNFNGTGAVAIRASGNVSSITDNGTGNYTVNFSTAMPDASYAVSGFANYAASSAPAGLVTYGSGYSPSTSAVQIGVGNSTTGTGIDVPYVNVAIHR